MREWQDKNTAASENPKVSEKVKISLRGRAEGVGNLGPLRLH